MREIRAAYGEDGSGPGPMVESTATDGGLDWPSGGPGAVAAGGSEDATARAREEVARLTAALEDVVAIALSDADSKERATLMHRRAITALTGLAMTDPPRQGAD